MSTTNESWRSGTEHDSGRLRSITITEDLFRIILTGKLHELVLGCLMFTTL